MKYQVRRFKSLELALKEIEPFVRNGAHLQTGNPCRVLGRRGWRMASQQGRTRLARSFTVCRGLGGWLAWR